MTEASSVANGDTQGDVDAQMGEVDDELAGEVDSIVQPGAGSAMQTAEDDAPKAAAAAPKALPVVDNNKPPTTGLVYDVRLLGHSQPYSLSSQGKVEYPEIPERIRGIYMELRRRGIKDRCQMIKAVTADSVGDGQDPLRLVHSARLVRNLEKSQNASEIELKRLADTDTDIFFTPDTAMCARVACGGVISACLAVLSGQVPNAFAIVRGFCHVNNVAVATREIIRLGKARRVLIVDWDIHHGNGTQQEFYNDMDVLYFSVHRYENGDFYPFMKQADADSVGGPLARGRNVNVPWPSTGFGDPDYLLVWKRILMPIANEFDPDIVIVSAGFDAAEGDPLGECNVTPMGFAHLTRKLMGLAGGHVVLALEGGYNIPVVAKAAAACASALLGDPLAQLPNIEDVKQSCHDTIEKVIGYHAQYWDCFGRKVIMPELGTKQYVDVSRDVLDPMCFPVSTAVRWYTRSIMMGLLRLTPLQIAPIMTMDNVEPSFDAVDPMEVFASAYYVYGEGPGMEQKVSDGPASYYHEILSRGHPMVATDFCASAFEKHVSANVNEAVLASGRRLWEAVSSTSPSSMFILIGAGRGADIVADIVNQFADVDSRVYCAILFSHRTGPRKILPSVKSDIVHQYISGYSHPGRDAFNVTNDKFSQTLAELMIRHRDEAFNFIKSRILASQVDALS